MICSNCDQNKASYTCLDCTSSECALCEACKIIHGKVKIFAKHRVQKCASNEQPTNLKYANVEISVDELQSEPKDIVSFLYEGVDRLAARIVATLRFFKDFEIDESYLSDAFDLSEGFTIRSGVACVGIAFLIHVVLKFALGRRAIFAIIGVGILIFRNLKRKRSAYVSEIDALQRVRSFRLSDVHNCLYSF